MFARKLTTTLGALTLAFAFLTTTSMAVTILINDNFENDYTEGQVTGQTAPSGQVWTNVPWNPGELSWKPNAGIGGSGGLGGHGMPPVDSYWTSTMPLGTTVDASSEENVIHISFDMRAGGNNGGAANFTVQLETIGGGGINRRSSACRVQTISLDASEASATAPVNGHLEVDSLLSVSS